MRKADMQAVGEAAGEALGAGGALIGELHRGIASRPFGVLGVWAAPARVIHDGVSRTVYAGVRGALRAGSRAAADLAAMRARDDAPPLPATPAGSFVLGAVNGFYGDRLRTRGNGLAVDMDLRRHGTDVAPTAEGLARAYPDASPRIAVFVHGLCGDDQCWRLFPLRGREGRRTYGERLQDDLGLTPVEVRYNTGLHISDNGRTLARLIEEVVTHWPVAVDEIVLVGHSMGGLVVRSACHYAEADDLRWTRSVRHVFCLGSPHLGADLEKGANALAWALGRLPETRALAALLNTRSAGIKDLRFGSCAEADWCDGDPDEFLTDRCTEVPFLPEAAYYFVGATLRPGPLGTLLGDLLVRAPSASGRGDGRGRRIPFEVDNGHELSGVNHFDLLNHPAVYDQIVAWITRTPPQALADAATG